MPTEREQPKDKFSRLPSLEKVSRDPVEYDCYGYHKLEGDCKRKADAIDVKLFFFTLKRVWRSSPGASRCLDQISTVATQLSHVPGLRC